MADIIETAIQAEDFRVFETALRTADMMGTLKETGPFYRLCPNDAAFSQIPNERMLKLLRDEPLVKQILQYHVVEGQFTAEDIEEQDRLRTMLGEDLLVDTAHGLMVNSASIVQSDIECDNGIIHVIDRVLLPKVASERR